MAQAQISRVRSPGAPLANIATQLADALRGRYVIQRELGPGGMATVYLARERRHGRPVALKVFRPTLAVTDRMRRQPQLTPDA